MRAIAVERFGGPATLVELPKPVPGAGEVLVRLAAAGVNPFDRKVADGMMDGSMPHTFPLVLGVDGAGVVESIGPDVTRFSPGDRIFGSFFHAPVGTGTYADYVTVPEDNALAAVPEGLDPVVAAALPTAGQTALGLVEALDPFDGMTVLLVGATGGVGVFTVQLAAAAGVRVIATGGAADADRLRDLGAADVIDHRAGPVSDRVHQVDALVDVVSDRAGFTANLRAVRPGGRALTTTFSADPDALAARGISGGDFEMRGTPEALARLAESVLDGRLRVPVEHRVRLVDAPEELERIRSTGSRGKTVVVL